MNTNINFQLFRAFAIGVFMFFSFVESAYAAPALTPPAVAQVTSDSARIIGFVSNHYANTTVWFEVWGPGEANMPTAYATQGIWHEGRFEWTVNDLSPGKTYYFRTAGMQGGATTYSPVSTFVTVSPKTATPINIIYEKKEDAPVQARKVQKTVAKEVEVKSSTQAVSGFTREGFNNTASVIGAGSSTLPTTLVGWIALFVAMLVLVLIGRMIFDSIEDRERHREEERRNREFSLMREAEKKEHELL